MRCFVEAVNDLGWKDEVLLEMRNVFQKYHFMVERNVVEEHKMLMQLPHVTYVGNYRQSKLPGH